MGRWKGKLMNTKRIRHVENTAKLSGPSPNRWGGRLKKGKLIAIERQTQKQIPYGNDQIQKN